MNEVPNPPTNMPQVIASLTCDDVAAAARWLCDVFGFRERTEARVEHEGEIFHAEVEVGERGLVMLGPPFDDRSSPKTAGGTTAMIVAYVDDVDAHFETARAKGAHIRAEPEDTFYGDRAYRASDPEGHHWMLTQHVRDVPPEEWDWSPGVV